MTAEPIDLDARRADLRVLPDDVGSEVAIDVRAVALRCQHAVLHAGLVAGRYGARALHPVVLGTVAGRILRGAGMAAYGAYWLVSAQDLQGIHARDPKYVHRQRLTRLRIAGAGLLGLAGGGVYGYLHYPLYAAGATMLAAGVLYRVGRTPADAALMTPTLPRGPLVAGVSGRQVVAEVTATFEQLGLDAQAVTAGYRGWGWEILVSTRVPIADISKAIDRIETNLHARPRSITPAQDPSNAALVTLRAVTGDPLADLGESPYHPPQSQSIGNPVCLGKQITGQEIRISMEGTHIALVGVTGSGKTGTMLQLVNHVTACRDAIAVGGQCGGGPELPAWGANLRRYADTPDGVEDLLRWAIGVAKSRCDRLAASAAPTAEDDPDAPAPRRTHTCTAQEPAVVVFLDEFPQILAESAEAKSLVVQLVRIGRKAAVSVVIAAQRAKADELGDTTIREMCTVKVLHACAENDVTQLLGAGSIAQGWAAHRLRPAAKGADGQVTRHDAGRCYVWGQGYSTPVLGGVYELDDDDVRRLAIERLRHGVMPALPGAGQLSMLDRVREVFRVHGDPEGMKTSELAKHLGVTEQQVADGLARHGVRTGRFTRDGVQERGYRRDAVFASL